MLDVQIGFGIAQVFDPVTRRQAPILTSAFNQVALVVFFLSNGHHVLLRGLAYSFERFPPARTAWTSLDAGPVLKHAAGLFALGFALVAPVVFCVFLLEFVLGVLTRNLPQMQMFALAVPLKIVVGMAALGLWLVGAQGTLAATYASIFQAWEAVFR
jgi:flagellar biosynthetic protein FliR